VPAPRSQTASVSLKHFRALISARRSLCGRRVPLAATCHGAGTVSVAFIALALVVVTLTGLVLLWCLSHNRDSLILSNPSNNISPRLFCELVELEG